MKKMQIFEPAMCCSTGLCGVGINPELLRISTVLNTLNKTGVVVDRFNLSGSPMEFVNNKVVNQYLNAIGADGLPIILLDGQIIITGRYPTNAELTKLLDLPAGTLESKPIKVKVKVTPKKAGSCSCKGGCC